MHADVKTHEILVLLLRLRQLCCHPALIHAMLDQEQMQVSGIMNEEGISPEVLSRFSNISLNEIDNHGHSEEEDKDIHRKIMHNVLTADNPVFSEDRVGSKVSDDRIDLKEKYSSIFVACTRLIQILKQFLDESST